MIVEIGEISEIGEIGEIGPISEIGEIGEIGEISEICEVIESNSLIFRDFQPLYAKFKVQINVAAEITQVCLLLRQHHPRTACSFLYDNTMETCLWKHWLSSPNFLVKFILKPVWVNNVTKKI